MPSAEIPQFLRKDLIVDSLTDREWQILNGAANGLNHTENGQEHGINFHTIESHLDKIAKKVARYEGFGFRNKLLGPLVRDGVIEGRIIVRDVPKVLNLSRREKEASDLIAQGKVAIDVAEEMVVEFHTAENYFGRVYSELGVNKFLHAVAKLAAMKIDAHSGAIQTSEVLELNAAG